MLRHWRLELLLGYGARVGARTNSGKTALDYARKYEHPAAADALLLAADAAADAAAAAAADAAAAAAVAAAAALADSPLEMLLARRRDLNGAPPPPLTVEEVAGVYEYPLDGFQKEATRMLIEGSSVVRPLCHGHGMRRCWRVCLNACV
jgi:hypothetical protein